MRLSEGLAFDMSPRASSYVDRSGRAVSRVDECALGVVVSIRLNGHHVFCFGKFLSMDFRSEETPNPKYI